MIVKKVKRDGSVSGVFECVFRGRDDEVRNIQGQGTYLQVPHSVETGPED